MRLPKIKARKKDRMKLLRLLKALIPYLLAAFALFYFGNLFWSIGLMSHYGGSALQGSAHDGHYYLFEHGSSVEVSKAVWENIRLHEMVLDISAIPGFGSFALLLLQYVFPAVMGLRRGPAVAERVAAVRASGEQLARERCMGTLANVSLGIPVIVVEVYPAGLLVQYFLSPSIAILRSELRSVTRKKWNRLEIDHRSPDLGGVIRLRTQSYSAFDQALGQLVSVRDESTRRWR